MGFWYQDVSGARGLGAAGGEASRFFLKAITWGKENYQFLIYGIKRIDT